MLSNLRLRFKYRGYTDTELKELNEMLTKFGRRCAHDLAHTVSKLRSANYLLGKEDDWFAVEATRRVELWKSVFYSDGGGKNYRSSIHAEQERLEREVERLLALCEKHGIDHTDPNSIPF